LRDHGLLRLDSILLTETRRCALMATWKDAGSLDASKIFAVPITKSKAHAIPPTSIFSTIPRPDLRAPPGTGASVSPPKAISSCRGVTREGKREATAFDLSPPSFSSSVTSVTSVRSLGMMFMD
jgi:hypothetical protein